MAVAVLAGQHADVGFLFVLEGGAIHAIAGVEGEREATCHFAGEHTSIDSKGYLNGAVESGERVAAEILGDLK